MMRWLAAALALAALPALAGQTGPVDYVGDARALDALIADNYAYLDRLPGGVLPVSATLDARRAAVHDRSSLLRYAEDRIASLADHHAITGSSFANSWALVPSYADLWIVRRADGYMIDGVRPDSPAAAAGIVAGDRLIAIGDVPVERAIADFWRDLGLSSEGERGAYAARVLAAGRRDRTRDLTIVPVEGEARRLTLANLYRDAPARPPVSLHMTRAKAVITINDSLGGDATIAAFDAAMRQLPHGLPLEIDLTDTPGGGNTTVARAMLGWFVDRPMPYQIHNQPAELRRTGVPRQWVEQVLPRAGKRHLGPITIRVGRWTGSMGEGLAIGFDAIGARVIGSPMAGLRGAVYDFNLPSSGLVVKLPAERLMAVDGTPREAFIPKSPR